MTSKFLTKQFYINLSVVFLIFIFDRLSKIYVLFKDEKSLEPNLFSSEFLNISLIWNSGDNSIVNDICVNDIVTQQIALMPTNFDSTKAITNVSYHRSI